MKITDTKRAKAKALFADPLIQEILDHYEQVAINKAVTAETGDHETRQSSMVEVRAMRRLRLKLKSISEDQADDEDESST